MTPRGGRQPGSGRPTEIENGKRHNVYISQPDWEKLNKIGDGSVSYAIRTLLEDGQCPECGAMITAADLIKHQEEHGSQNVHE